MRKILLDEETYDKPSALLSQGKTIAVIGGGFGGLSVLHQLVHDAPRGTKILLYEKNGEKAVGHSPAWGKDLPFASPTNTRAEETVLSGGKALAAVSNKAIQYLDPASSLSEKIPHPLDPLDIAHDFDPNFRQTKSLFRGKYLPRSIVGAFNRETFNEICHEAALKNTHLEIIPEEVTDINKNTNGLSITSTNSERQADTAILCLGPGKSPFPYKEVNINKPTFLRSYPLRNFVQSVKNLQRYPHMETLRKRLLSEGKSGAEASAACAQKQKEYESSYSLGIIGCGLQSLDVLRALQQSNYTGKIIITSRSGELPAVRYPESNENPRFFTMEKLQKLAKSKRGLSLEKIVNLVKKDFSHLNLKEDLVLLLANEFPILGKFGSTMLSLRMSRIKYPRETHKTAIEKLTSQINRVKNGNKAGSFLKKIIDQSDEMSFIKSHLPHSEYSDFLNFFNPILNRYRNPMPIEAGEMIVKMAESGQLTLIPGIEKIQDIGNHENPNTYTISFHSQKNKNVDAIVDTTKMPQAMRMPLLENMGKHKLIELKNGKARVCNDNSSTLCKNIYVLWPMNDQPFIYGVTGIRKSAMDTVRKILNPPLQR